MVGGAEVSNSRHEAIRWMFCLLGKPMEQSNGMVEQAIDYIIKAAVDEMKATSSTNAKKEIKS